MRARADFLEGLLELHMQPDARARRVVFRQSITSLAIEASTDGPPPLDGLRPEALLESIRAALKDGLFDDLSWLAPPAAAVALYEITGALPLGPERRDLGRRVVSQLYDGDAATFVALATRMALGNARALDGAPVRARIALALQLGSNVDVPVDPLAFALVSRRELARDWVGTAATGSLPERRLAARLLERACREAARRASQGDDDALRLFRGIGSSSAPINRNSPLSDVVCDAYRRLLTDRETLVWRHASVARGLLSGVIPSLREEIRGMLGTNLSPTEWRRAATSLVASIAFDPQEGLAACKDLLASNLVRKDPGIPMAMIWGLPRAIDAEPEAAETLLDAIAEAHPIIIADGLIELNAELGTAFGARARTTCIQALSQSLTLPQDDDGLTALGQCMLRDLEGHEPSELAAAVRSAVAAFVEIGCREAAALALTAIEHASSTLDALEVLGATTAGDTTRASMSRRTAARLLRELDMNLYESGLLRSLVLLERRTGGNDSGAALGLDQVDDRVTRWLLRVEAASRREGGAAHLTFHQRNLRTLLHVVDGEATDGTDEENRGRGKLRLLETCDVLTRRLAAEAASPLRRAVAATVARAFDALVRANAVDAADALLYASMRTGDRGTLEVIAEASVHPDVRELFACFGKFTAALRPEQLGNDPTIRVDAAHSALTKFISELPAGTSQRIEGLRSALSRLARSLDAVRSARALAPLADATGKEGSPLAALEDALSTLSRLTSGALRRFSYTDDDEAPASVAFSGESLATIVGMARDGSAAPNLEVSIDKLVTTASSGLPGAIAQATAIVLRRLLTLPSQPAIVIARPYIDALTAEAPLPAWLPPHRMVGGFYVHRRLGGGSLGSVFVVSRAEERHDPNAEKFALKVPDYDATAARSVSESEFLKLFRQEAGALLSLPDHINLPRFVTFDAGARPKPILVMELIDGIRCEHLIDNRHLNVETTLVLLDGILAGLEAMHSEKIGHLDLKPSNVVLRAGTEPVLVDFGLAGRQIRPGCATAAYGAPEVWGAAPDGAVATPMTADIYSFGCLAYEILSGNMLFDASSDAAMITVHVSHDGLPQKIRRITSGRLASLGMFLFQCLRHNPNDRTSATGLRAVLRRIAPELQRCTWPIIEEE
ncbi:MAG: serine/threonine protein kinase [Polyangiaceae bacterium]|nr:serine/threonine protein kinase [Polyangiaceae bacterium]